MARVLSGIQPSGKLHLGNYAGAIRQFLDLQAANEMFVFVASYHALTSVRDPAVLRDNIRQVVIDYLAYGLDPERTSIYVQHDVPEVTELCWLLSCVCPVSMMDKAVSYKDKVAKGLAANVGLYVYPILQAADILAVDADLVPVGKDQVQHLEMTQDIAGKFNRAFDTIFPIPNWRLDKESRVPGVDGQKMSKSYGNTIDLFAEGKALEKTVMSMKTDSTPMGQPLDPDKCNFFALYALFATEDEKQALAADYRAGKIGYGHAKKQLKAKIDAYFEPFRAQRKELAQRPDTVEDILRTGATKARAEARITMDLVRKATGL